MSDGTATAETYAHIEVDADGVAAIAGTTMKVIELVMAQIAHGWSPQELRFQFPHLSLGQIHSALAYYWDHREHLEDEIRRSVQAADDARAKAGPSRVAERLLDGAEPY